MRGAPEKLKGIKLWHTHGAVRAFTINVSLCIGSPVIHHCVSSLVLLSFHTTLTLTASFCILHTLSLIYRGVKLEKGRSSFLLHAFCKAPSYSPSALWDFLPAVPHTNIHTYYPSSWAFTMLGPAVQIIFNFHVSPPPLGRTALVSAP